MGKHLDEDEKKLLQQTDIVEYKKLSWKTYKTEILTNW